MNIGEIKKSLKKVYFKYTGKIKQKKIKNKDFTIVANNCFGGIFYRNNFIEYQSPTCGLAFMAKEYIKFIYNMKHYLSIDEIEEIKMEQSKYASYLKLIQYKGVIGKIDDVEIMFLHYDTIEEAREKWNRRKKRINYNKIIYKFNDQNLCTYDELKAFNDFPAKNKICFTAKKYSEFDTIQLEQYKDNTFVLSDVNEKDYKKYFNMYKYLNERIGENEKN